MKMILRSFSSVKLITCLCLLVLLSLATSIQAQNRPPILSSSPSTPNASGFSRAHGIGHGGHANRLTDFLLRKILRHKHVSAIDAPTHDTAKVVLGQALFFDRILSGNKDTACATCHHPLLGTSDGLALPVGTGTPTVGNLGLQRVRGVGRHFVPRNAPEIFNRGSVLWTSQFWDSRLEITEDNVMITPAGDDLPEGLATVLEAQAMFPVTSRDEMRGSLDDVLEGNELAAIDDDDMPAMWDALMVRLLNLQGYRDLFQNAYPGVQESDLGFQHAASAIAAFEATAYGDTDSPFDEYLRGNSSALTLQQKRGALLFYGRARCSSCHSGTLFTDLSHHNIGTPQIGPGKDPLTGLDHGRSAISGDLDEEFKFRTPPLRNVAATAPYLHNGAYSNLKDVIRHHMNPRKALRRYNPEVHLAQVDLRPLVLNDLATRQKVLRTLDLRRIHLRESEIDAIVAFLESLTVPDLEARLIATIPASVPSGLLEDGAPQVDD